MTTKSKGPDLSAQAQELLSRLGASVPKGEGTANLAVFSPIDAGLLAELPAATEEEAHISAMRAVAAFKLWRDVPPPVRGELVRLFGQELRAAKEDLGRLVTLECGKILAEGRGEVQEMVDICDFAVGLSRQLYGLNLASERPLHHMREMWHPLGPVCVISAFNFPVAVWAWNAALAWVCGDSVVWKPSEKTPLSALACQALFLRAAARFEREQGRKVPAGLCEVVFGERGVGEALVASPAFPLVSATGSTPMGRSVGEVVARRCGKALLELGGNNAMIVSDAADLGMVVRSVLFSAVGTAGQRCTTLRRLIVQQGVAERLLDSLVKTYRSLKIGSPLDPGTLVGPLIDKKAGERMDAALKAATEQGGEVLVGGEKTDVPLCPGGCYRAPAIVRMPAQSAIVREETFAPILYVLTYDTLEEAIALNNAVPQGLSSCIFTTDMRESEKFLSALGSDCGIANVNIGPSGAEIGGAFGGEKETGGGRESGSDSWRNYMRRQTQTVNFSSDLPLAQGVVFDVT